MFPPLLFLQGKNFPWCFDCLPEQSDHCYDFCRLKRKIRHYQLQMTHRASWASSCHHTQSCCQRFKTDQILKHNERKHPFTHQQEMFCSFWIFVWSQYCNQLHHNKKIPVWFWSVIYNKYISAVYKLSAQIMFELNLRLLISSNNISSINLRYHWICIHFIQVIMINFLIW